MTNINNLERQHAEIRELITNISRSVDYKPLEENIDIIVKYINTLAGKITIHMNTEDNFLYPALLNSNNEQIRIIAKEYKQEMGNISNLFNLYKNKFNTKSKILNNIETFSKETIDILSLLQKRIEKEDKNLYPKIKE
ncbi:hypothetical protein ABG79_02464 [Caloramator mitchellensis]|uniref:Hemerythrin-like domain-containing protein n=1 Tax=Caloramator mitchellensis TaxID=908809 RepID=A0A0R3JQP3_CALMK|nr:hemerythrin domain-containing protein [Caloramator mitchellensis]KRQ85763.1 hypothetical protein ABG79_02464 [Caloramator mitchellensis]